MTAQEANLSAAVDAINYDALIAAGLQAVERSIYHVIRSEINVLHDASRHLLDAGGKRIRPRLLMLIYLANGGTDVEYAAPPAAAVELMHTASVVHDDINDHGIVRRGRPSINSKWGRTFALLTGDFLFTTVYQLMAPYGDLNIELANAATALVEGETLQASAVKDNNFTREIYGRIIALKTAALFRAATIIGCKLANAGDHAIDALAQYGYNIGLAFQITDDILDIIGDEKILGKTAGIDIEQGRGFAAARAAPGKEDTGSLIKYQLLQGNTLQNAKAQANNLVETALNYLDVLPESPAKDELIELAYQATNRQY